MQPLLTFPSRVRTLFLTLLGGLCLLSVAAVPQAGATLTTFAQFQETDNLNNFKFTNNGGTSGTLSSLSPDAPTYQGVPVFFRYTSIAGLPGGAGGLAGFQDAHLTISSTTTAEATPDGANFSQILNGTTTIVIKRDVPFGGKDNLLTITITSTSINGGGGGATLTASSISTGVVFSSDFLDFTPTIQRDASLSFSSVTPSLSIGPGNFLNSFTAAGTGTFSSDPAPTYVPEGDALPALGFLVGMVGVWELFRRFRQGWSVVGRDG